MSSREAVNNNILRLLVRLVERIEPSSNDYEADAAITISSLSTPCNKYFNTANLLPHNYSMLQCQKSQRKC